jgi:hypothetical protein
MESAKRNGHYGDQGVDGRRMLKWILKSEWQLTSQEALCSLEMKTVFNEVL